MKLTRWSPDYGKSSFHELFDSGRGIDRLFDWSEHRDFSFEPKINVSQDKDKIKIKANLHGFKEKDVKVSVEDGVLRIKGEKKEESNKKGKDYYHHEYTYGYFERSFSLPSFVDTKKVITSYRNGVWDITPTPESHVRKSVDEWLSGSECRSPEGRRSSENKDAMAVLGRGASLCPRSQNKV